MTGKRRLREEAANTGGCHRSNFGLKDCFLVGLFSSHSSSSYSYFSSQSFFSVTNEPYLVHAQFVTEESAMSRIMKGNEPIARYPPNKSTKIAALENISGYRMCID